MSDKVDNVKSAKGSVAEAPSQEDTLAESNNFAVKILMLRYSLAFILCGLAAGLGASSFLLLRYRELSTFHGEFTSATIQTTRSLSDSIMKICIAANLMNDIYANALNTTGEAMLPNYTLPGYQSIVGNLNKLCNARATSFSPLLTNDTRQSWEVYAKDNVGLLHGPPSLQVSTNGSRVVADGIYAYRNGRATNAPDYYTDSKYPTLLFPIWQLAPETNNSAAVMYDPHSDGGTRMEAIDQVVATLQGASTDIVQLVFDKGAYRPSTILYFPVTDINDSEKGMMGLFGIAFTWDEILRNVLPSYINRIDCVIRTKTTSFTIALDNGQVYIVGQGDLHDNVFDKYAKPVELGTFEFRTDLGAYSIILYPTEALYATYITSYPQNVCVGAVVIIVFTALVFTLYVYLVNIRQAKLEEVATRSFVREASRDAVLQSKKIYVRYISHEMRTPLNVAFLGLKILSKDLKRDPENLDRLETVTDISKACQMALSILNDLLNYDKLEDGTLLIEPERVVALSFILESTEVLNLQAKEKGLELIFDVDQNSDVDTLGNINLNNEIHFIQDINDHKKTKSSTYENENRNQIENNNTMNININEKEYTISYLTGNDFINVDPYKMNQVIGNIISNAIKFTPVGQSVTIKARKFILDISNKNDLSNYVLTSKDKKNSLSSFPSKSKEKNYFYSIMNCFLSCPSTNNDNDNSSNNNNDIEVGNYININNNKGYDTTDNSYKAENNNNNNNIISTSTVSEYGFLIVEVTDSGVGMAPEDSKRLFKEIVQFNPSKLQAGGGSGLGMMITKGIVDLHQGEISVYSAGEGLGSTFTLKLPLIGTPILSPTESIVGDSAYPSRTNSFSNLREMILKANIDEEYSSSINCKPTNDEIVLVLNGSESNDSVDDDDEVAKLPSTECSSTPFISTYNDKEIINNDVDNKIVEISTSTTTSTSASTSKSLITLQTPFTSSNYQTTPSTTGFNSTSSSGTVLSPSVEDVITSKKFRILVVDDSKLNRRMLIKSLKANSHICEEAEDGLEAVEKIKKILNDDDGICNFYDAILMDFMMPNMDGPSATKVIRKMGYTGVIIGVTGNALPSDVYHFTVSGADSVLLKPVDMDALEEALFSLLHTAVL